MASSSEDTASYEELSTLYEACLLNYRQVCENSKENSRNADFVGQSLAARVALRSAVQCAAAQQDPVQFAQALLERTTLDLDEDAASPEQVQAIENLLPKKEDAKRVLLPKIDVDVDSFFEVYPECERLHRQESESDSSEDEGESRAWQSNEKHRRRGERGDNGAHVEVVGQNLAASRGQPKPKPRPQL